MDCNEYANNLVSAHADGELTPQELTAVNEHVSGCARCTSRLEEERALKQILRRRADQMHAPQQLSRRIAALAAEPPKAKKRRGRIWQPIAAAMAIAAAAVFYFTVGRDLLTPANPQFDQAIESYTEFEKNFQPNVTASNVASLGEQYRAQTDVPVFVWNF